MSEIDPAEERMYVAIHLPRADRGNLLLEGHSADSVSQATLLDHDFNTRWGCVLKKGTRCPRNHLNLIRAGQIRTGEPLGGPIGWQRTGARLRLSCRTFLNRSANEDRPEDLTIRTPR